jgi:glucokinase-like ROK family protein
MVMSPITVRVLAAVRSQGAALSKADIVRLTDLSLATVTEHVELLRANGLLREQEFGASSGGRKPKLYGFNAEAGCLVAIDLESTHVNVALADFGLSILHHASSDDVDVARGPEATLQNIRDVVLGVLKAAGVKAARVKGIGMGLPGPVSFSQALPSSLPLMPGWENYPVREFWRPTFSCPVFVDNNVYTMALGERAIDPPNAPNNMIFVKVGNGIGAGIICDGAMHRGATEHAGEIGHINIGHDTLCYCGNRGCLEAVAGGRAIAMQAEGHARAGRSERLAAILTEKKRLSLADVIRAVQQSDPIAVALIRESGNAIGGVLASLANFFNPSHIVVGGGVAEAGDYLIAAIRQAIYQHSLPLVTRTLVIRQSSVGRQAGVIGAATLALDHALREASTPASTVAKLAMPERSGRGASARRG